MAVVKDQAISLRRISSRGQSDGHSLEAQAASTEGMATELNVEIIRTWDVVKSSKKGKNFKRDDMEEALRFCKVNPRVGYFLFDFVNRMMREADVLFYYKVLFNQLGVELIFCDSAQRHLNGNDQYAQLMLMLEAYKAEQDNATRNETTVARMKSRYAAGYYTSHPHAGYKKSAIKGLHVPDPERFDKLKECCHLIIYKQYSIPQAVKWLNDVGYLTPGGKRMDVNKFTAVVKDRYYCGWISIKSEGWPKDVRGLHQPMLSDREHSLLVKILSKRNPRVRQKHNPEFPESNLARHFECEGFDKEEKFTGFYKNRGKRNGKPRNKLPVYRCRHCRKEFSRNKLHDCIGGFIGNLELLPDTKTFKEALLRVWKNQRGSKEQRLLVLNRKQDDIKRTIAETTTAYVKESEGVIRDEMRKLIEGYNSQLKDIETEIASTQLQDIESEDFVNFAIDFVDNLRGNWWDLSFDARQRGEQILFNSKLYVDNSANVHTPELSTIYRLGANKKDLNEVNFVNMVELPGTAPGSVRQPIVRLHT